MVMYDGHGTCGIIKVCCRAPTDVAPVHAPPDVPPTSWIDDMRTPPLEVVLSQFRTAKGISPRAPPADLPEAAPDQPPLQQLSAAPANAGNIGGRAADAAPLQTPRSGPLQFSN
jgi:hypothetical protein